jgi:hypothetical protein
MTEGKGTTRRAAEQRGKQARGEQQHFKDKQLRKLRCVLGGRSSIGPPFFPFPPFLHTPIAPMAQALTCQAATPTLCLQCPMHGRFRSEQLHKAGYYHNWRSGRPLGPGQLSTGRSGLPELPGMHEQMAPLILGLASKGSSIFCVHIYAALQGSVDFSSMLHPQGLTCTRITATQRNLDGTSMTCYSQHMPLPREQKPFCQSLHHEPMAAAKTPTQQRRP